MKFNINRLRCSSIFVFTSGCWNPVNYICVYPISAVIDFVRLNWNMPHGTSHVDRVLFWTELSLFADKWPPWHTRLLCVWVCDLNCILICGYRHLRIDALKVTSLYLKLHNAVTTSEINCFSITESVVVSISLEFFVLSWKKVELLLACCIWMIKREKNALNKWGTVPAPFFFFCHANVRQSVHTDTHIPL